MSTAPKIAWEPTTSLSALRLRAKLYADIREFFRQRNVLEVETPLLSQHGVTDVYIESFKTQHHGQRAQIPYFLQTSPEYAMKRLLAAGSGSIFQIVKAFRNEDSGRHHNPEFTMLEWYRVGFNYHDLMDEMDELLQFTIQSKKSERKTYEQLFLEHVKINPFDVSLPELQSLAKSHSLDDARTFSNRDDLLQFLFSHAIEPKIGFTAPVFVYDFPASQAALAKIHPTNPTVAQRFEVYIQGIECANGFDELMNAAEQRQRFEKDNHHREQLGRAPMKIDERFLAALEHGLPTCAGVALGLDRLLMIKANTNTIRDVISFPCDLA